MQTILMFWDILILHNQCQSKHEKELLKCVLIMIKEAGAELGHAQLKLGFDFTLVF